MFGNKRNADSLSTLRCYKRATGKERRKPKKVRQATMFARAKHLRHQDKKQLDRCTTDQEKAIPLTVVVRPTDMQLAEQKEGDTGIGFLLICSRPNTSSHPVRRMLMMMVSTALRMLNLARNVMFQYSRPQQGLCPASTRSCHKTDSPV